MRLMLGWLGRQGITRRAGRAAAVGRVVAFLGLGYVFAHIGLMVHLIAATRTVDPGEGYRTQGTHPVAVYGAMEDTACWIDDGAVFTAVRYEKGGMFTAPTAHRVEADNRPKVIRCGQAAQVTESPFVPLYRLVETGQYFTAAAALTSIAAVAGWVPPTPFAPLGAVVPPVAKAPPVNRGLSGSSPRRETSRRRGAFREPRR